MNRKTAERGSAGTVPEPNARLRLRYLEICIKAGRFSRGAAVAAGMRGQVSGLQPHEMHRLIRAAEKIGDDELLVSAIEHLATQDVLLPNVALHLVRLAHGSGDEGLAEQLVSDLQRTFPNLKSTVFPQEAAFLRFGPDAALREVRRTRRTSRGVLEAVKLAQLLMASGDAPLAFRYLRRCQKKWPNAPQFRNLLVSACLQSGNLDAGWAFLDRLAADAPDLDLRVLRLQLLMGSGAMEPAYELARDLRENGGGQINPQQYLHLCLSLGHLNEARTVTSEAAEARGHGQKALQQFSVSHLGAVLNDLKLYRRAAASPAPGPARHEGEFFFAAKKALDRWLAQKTDEERPRRAIGSNIPKRIFQYWDTPTLPQEITAATQSWAAADTYSYRLLDHRGAVEFLRARFDAAHIQAFRLANHAAEAADFIRLCLLLAEGGIYADADDKLLGHPDTLRGLGSGMILFREPCGAIANNLICARPGHRLLQLAVDMARTSLLADDNDNTWSKTGPGLLTRATAVYLSQVSSNEARRDLTIVPQFRMRSCVHQHMRMPYKSTAGYWNASVEVTPERVMGALRKLAGPATPGEAR